MRRSLIAALVTLAFVIPTAAPAAAADTAVLATPGSYIAGYTTPAMVASPGGTLTLINLDAQLHDVVSYAVGSPEQPWCGNFLVGQCPLFWSPLIGLTEQTVVLGLEHIVPGEFYDFYCSIHENTMQGVLLAQAD